MRECVRGYEGTRVPSGYSGYSFAGEPTICFIHVSLIGYRHGISKSALLGITFNM